MPAAELSLVVIAATIALDHLHEAWNMRHEA